MVRGRTTAPAGLVLGHEITGEIVEKGRDVEFLNVGDIVSVPFNIACGRCRNCKEGKTGICLNVNPSRPGAAYGYVDMGGWVGGQAEYVLVPYADFNLLKFPDRDQAMAKIADLTLLSDIFPTGYHGAVTAGVGPGSIVYVAGGGPVGLASAASCQLLGAACVIVGDLIPQRLKQAKKFGCEVVDLRQSATLAEQIEQIVGVPEVDCAVDCVGFEARGHGADTVVERPATVLNALMEVTRAGGGSGIPGLYVTGDPGGVDDNAKGGNLSIRIGLGWANGTTATPDDYENLLIRSASHGILVTAGVSTNTGNGDQVAQCIRELAAARADSNGSFATAGHSQGGGGCVNAARRINGANSGVRVVTTCQVQPDGNFTTGLTRGTPNLGGAWR